MDISHLQFFPSFAICVASVKWVEKVEEIQIIYLMQKGPENVLLIRNFFNVQTVNSLPRT